MATTKQAEAAAEWGSFKTAAGILGVNVQQVQRMVSRGSLTTRRLPNTRPLVDLAEVRRIAAGSVRHGSASEALSATGA